MSKLAALPSVEKLAAALAPDQIMLDNFTPEMLETALDLAGPRNTASILHSLGARLSDPELPPPPYPDDRCASCGASNARPGPPTVARHDYSDALSILS
mgnify:CR=1 FL=1